MQCSLMEFDDDVAAAKPKRFKTIQTTDPTVRAPVGAKTGPMSLKELHAFPDWACPRFATETAKAGVVLRGASLIVCFQKVGFVFCRM